MSEFDRFFQKVQLFDVHKILREVWRKPAVQKFIVELNTEGQPTSQLFEKGEDAKGKSLPPYKQTTIEGTSSFQGKKQKGQRFDHMTLKDTGAFYDSFFVRPFLKGFRIEADGVKEDGSDLFSRYGEDIAGLNEENKVILCEFIRPFFIAEAEKILS